MATGDISQRSCGEEAEPKKSSPGGRCSQRAKSGESTTLPSWPSGPLLAILPPTLQCIALSLGPSLPHTTILAQAVCSAPKALPYFQLQGCHWLPPSPKPSSQGPVYPCVCHGYGLLPLLSVLLHRAMKVPFQTLWCVCVYVFWLSCTYLALSLGKTPLC